TSDATITWLVPPPMTHSRRRQHHSLDHLVGERTQLWRHLYAERFGRLHIEHGLVFHRPLHGKVGRLLAPQDAVDIAGCEAKLFELIGGVRDQSAGRDEYAGGIDRRQTVARRETDDQLAVEARKTTRRDGQAGISIAGNCRDATLDL